MCNNCKLTNDEMKYLLDYLKSCEEYEVLISMCPFVNSRNEIVITNENLKDEVVGHYREDGTAEIFESYKDENLFQLENK